MPHRDPTEPDAEVLPQGEAARLLARASELDAARRSGTAVAELRAAAAEAGISTPAFDAALAELHGARQARVPEPPAPPRRGRLKRIVVAAAAVLIPLGAIALARSAAPARGVASAPAGVPVVEEAILLRCLAPGEAAELIRPLLRFRENAVVASPPRAPRVLTVRATAAQLQEVRALLDRHEGGEAPACAAAPAGPAGLQ